MPKAEPKIIKMMVAQTRYLLKKRGRRGCTDFNEIAASLNVFALRNDVSSDRNDAFSGEIALSGTPFAIGGLSRNDVLAMI